jgi:ATP-dependent helicase/DNAse subunit B
MGKINLHIGPRGSYYYFEEKILQQISSDTISAIIYLLPLNRAVRYLKKRLVSNILGGASFDPQVYTFQSLLQYLYRNLSTGKKVITKPVRLLLVDHILNAEKESLKFFQLQSVVSHGLAIKADKMIEEFCQFGYRPDDFSDPPLTAQTKYSDFAYLIQKLCALYNDKLIDEASLLGEVMNQIDSNLIAKMFPELRTIYISGFGIYSPPMLQFIELAGNSFNIEIKLEYDKSNPELFRHTHTAYDALSKISDHIMVDSGAEDVLEKIIFKVPRAQLSKEQLAVNIHIQQTDNRLAELRYLASEIKNRHHKENVSLNRIGITFPDIEKYFPLILKVFKEFGIPFNLSTGAPLSKSPLIQSFIQVLRIAASHFNIDEVYRLLVSPFLKNDMRPEALFIKLCSNKYKLKFLSDQWETIVRHRIDMTGDIIQAGGITDGKSESNLEEIITNINTIITVIQPLTNLLAAHEFKSVYLNVLQELGILNWFYGDEADLSIPEKEHEFRAFNRFIKIIDQIVWILNYLFKTTKMPVSDYFNYFTLVLENETFNLREWSDYGVQIMPRLEILSLDLDILFAGGFVEGQFPRHFSHDIFFNDDEREMMGLNASEDLLSQDRFLFFQLLSSKAKTVIFTYPSSDADEQQLPSTFLTALREIVPTISYTQTESSKEYLSRSTLAENLSQNLKSGVTEKNIYLYKLWTAKGNSKKITFWHNAIHVMYNRWSYDEITPFEGNLIESKTVKNTLKNYFQNRPFSITALESYAFCPMQFYLQRILRLEKEEESDTSITALERGNTVHKVLYEFYNSLDSEQRKKPWEHQKLLEEIALDIFQALPYDDIVWSIEKEKFFGNQFSAGLWHSFINRERESVESTGFFPLLTEAEFGYFLPQDSDKKSYPPATVQSNEMKMRIYGKIDRIDIDKNNHFLVIDYKTGSGATRINLNQIQSGLSLQLPVYIAAANTILTTIDTTYQPAAALYYLVQDGNNCKRIPIMVDQEKYPDPKVPKLALLNSLSQSTDDHGVSFSGIINESLEFTSQYIENIMKGNFKHTKFPETELCKTYCAYRRICRKNISKLKTIQAKS